MAGKTAVSEGYFDADQFWIDVLKWKARHNYTNYDIEAFTGLTRSTFRQLSHRATPSLLVVCALAQAADLSVDSYIRSPNGHKTA